MTFPTYTVLQQHIHDALGVWGAADKPVPSLLKTLVTVRLHAKQGRMQEGASWHRAVNTMLLAGIEELEKENREGGQILRQRFFDRLKARTVGNELNMSRHQVQRRQREALERLTQIVLMQERGARQQILLKLEGCLPPATYEEGLIGLDAVVPVLVNKLLLAEPPWMVALTGIGGIGKTSLADGVVRQVLSHFVYEGVVWIRVEEKRPFSNITETVFGQLAQQLNLPPHLSPPQRYQEIRYLFKKTPHLLVVDNIETDSDAVQLLLRLADLTNPSKVLLTMRVQPPGHLPVWVYSLDELPVEAASELVRCHAATIGLQTLAMPTAEQIAEMYRMTGGNPLAIKLIVGLARVMPLPMVLQDLHKVQVGAIEQMYRHIYRQAWQSLSPSARTLLQIMPLSAGNGFAPGHMLRLSQIAEELFWPAVYELVTRSLLEVRQTTPDWRYGIHRLTDSFLRTDVIHWDSSDLL